MLFFKINLHFGTSDNRSTCGKLNLLPINSIFWSALLQKCKEDSQTKNYYKLFYSVRKETSHKPSKVAATKKSFSSVYIIDTTCFDE